MIRTLTVFYLHKPGRFDAKRLPVIEYGLTDAFRDFCRETFDARGSLDYPPMKLVTVHDAPTLAKGRRSRRRSSRAGARGASSPSSDAPAVCS